jgi:hypothetical protein
MTSLGYFEESTDRPETQKALEQAKTDVANELAYREWNLARWSIGLTALVGLGAIAGAALARGNLK